MSNKSNFKKEATGICHYCDYNCRKGHKCSWFKRFVKTFKKCRCNVASEDSKETEENEQPELIFEVTVRNVIWKYTFPKLVIAYDKIDAIKKAKEELRDEMICLIQSVREVVEND